MDLERAHPAFFTKKVVLVFISDGFSLDKGCHRKYGNFFGATATDPRNYIVKGHRFGYFSYHSININSIHSILS